ncbi:hypothetical protein Pfo_019141 [Paulownia fortunei]|nr:hypothetical protein Pfo_019141 [Paulownia fortunei]
MKMMNLVTTLMTLLQALMKMAGITPHTVEIEPGTVINIWVPSETIKKPKKTTNSTAAAGDTSKTTKPSKPVVVLLHGFAGEGIITWSFQVGSLSKNYSVYVPDLLFFGGSTTDNPDRSPTFQAECMVKALRKLGIERCTVVGFSYGGMVAFKMAELHPEMVEALVLTGSVLALTDSISNDMVKGLRFSSLSEFLLPTSVKGCKKTFKAAVNMKLWLPDRAYKDFIKVMVTNRKERAELLQALVVRDKDTTKPNFPQRIHLLWGENDRIFKVELAQNMKVQLGDKATFQAIKKAGHLVNLERPKVFNRCLKKFLASLHADEARK